MFDFLYNFITSTFSSQIGRFINYPGFQERLVIFIANIPVCVGIVLVGMLGFLLIPKTFQDVFVKTLFSLLVIATLVTRSFYSYTYDTAFAAISLVTDISCLLYFLYRIGNIKEYIEKGAFSQRITYGISVFCLVLTAIGFVNANRFLHLSALVVTHGLFSLWILREIWTQTNVHLHKSDSKYFLILLISLLPFVPYLFSPAPPDADITTMSEMLGYLYQGQSLSNVASGIPGEHFSLRYPAGFPSLGLGATVLLNIRGSESLLILWILSFVLFVFNLANLGKKVGIPAILTAILCINPVVTGSTGLHGGQAQEILAYALGIGMLNFIISDKPLHSAICLAASMVIHPIVALPFCLILGTWGLVYISSTKQIREVLIAGIIISLALVYLAFLGLGESNTPSQPATRLSELTVRIFLDNVVRYLVSDSNGLYMVLVIIPFSAIFVRPKSKYMYLSVWLIGGLFLDGLFGDTQAVRFHAAFSIVGVWIIASGLFILAVHKMLSNQSRVRIVVLSFIMLLWFFRIVPNLTFKPVSVFTTHSNIRMGRFISSHVGEDAFIANIRPPGDPAPKGFGFMVRGDAARATLKGNVVSREAFSNCPPELPAAYVACLKGLGITHILIDARPGSRSYAMRFPIRPLKVIGHTYLFEL